MVSEFNIRRFTEEREETLSPYAARSNRTRGRLRAEDPCPIRTNFQRDRDRIIHSKSFRRLKHKTQVFIAPSGDHYVTRLTHTLEVSQSARILARALNLNEDLIEAIALGHDLGHTPFGHVGEEVLNDLYPPGFRHNEQSLRVVDKLENDGRGLNLTWEVRDGILNHSKIRADVQGEDLGKPGTLEGQLCKIADAIAYINHDIGDAIRTGLITEGDLPLAAAQVLGITHSQRINTMVSDIIQHSWVASGRGGDDEEPEIGMSREVLKATNILRQFLFEHVYDEKNKSADEAREIIRRLYDYFCRHEPQMPLEYGRSGETTERRVVDYIAGMTDNYAIRKATELSLIKAEE